MHVFFHFVLVPVVSVANNKMPAHFSSIRRQWNASRRAITILHLNSLYPCAVRRMFNSFFCPFFQFKYFCSGTNWFAAWLECGSLMLPHLLENEKIEKKWVFASVEIRTNNFEGKEKSHSYVNRK